jgi:hypothetical protein
MVTPETLLAWHRQLIAQSTMGVPVAGQEGLARVVRSKR